MIHSSESSNTLQQHLLSDAQQIQSSNNNIDNGINNRIRSSRQSQRTTVNEQHQQQRQTVNNDSSDLQLQEQQYQEEQQYQQESEQEVEEEEVFEEITRMMEKAIELFKIKNIAIQYFQIFKILIFGAYFFHTSFLNNCRMDDLTIIIGIFTVQSLIAAIYQYMIVKYIKTDEQLFEIAEQLDQVIFIKEGQSSVHKNTEQEIQYLQQMDPGYGEGQEENTLIQNHDSNHPDLTKKIHLMTTEIKYVIKKLQPKLKYLGWASFIVFHCLLITALVLFFKEYSPFQTFVGRNSLTNCERPQFILIIMIAITALFQYYDIYALIILMLAGSPFLLAFMAYSYVKRCLSKREKQKFMRSLKTIKFKDGILKGESECSICMTTYQMNEQIVKLPCNELHHFHSQCVKTWLSVTSNCPLCRKTFL